MVGIKPTVGLLARDGIIPVSESQDSPGPVARTVKDAVEILAIIAGRSEFDKRTWDIPFSTQNLCASCSSTSLSGIRIGIPRDTFSGIPASVIRKFDEAIEILAGANADVIEEANFSSLSEWDTWDMNDRNMQSEVHFKESIEEYLSTLAVNPKSIHTLEDIIEFTKCSPEEEYPSRNIDWWLASIHACKQPREELNRRLDKMLRLSREGIVGTLDSQKLDVLALASPSNCKAPVTFAARAGLPIITVPLGLYSPDTPVMMNSRGDLVERAPGMP